MTFFETMAKLLERYSSFFTEGIVNTLIIAAFAVLLGTVFGTLMATRGCAVSRLCGGWQWPISNLSAVHR